MLYSRKDVTFEKDKLFAISGLANLFGHQMGTEYFAGPWKIALISDLLWEVNANKYARDRPLTYRAPSWSWASVECPVKYLPGGYLRLRGSLFPDLSVVFDAETLYSPRKRSLKAPN
ncbi:hypothetical protein ACEPPN_005514 [Leptodophora sp. 'Broadleaf-Isolate-01']